MNFEDASRRHSALYLTWICYLLLTSARRANCDKQTNSVSRGILTPGRLLHRKQPARRLVKFESKPMNCRNLTSPHFTHLEAQAFTMVYFFVCYMGGCIRLLNDSMAPPQAPLSISNCTKIYSSLRTLRRKESEIRELSSLVLRWPRATAESALRRYYVKVYLLVNIRRPFGTISNPSSSSGSRFS